ncbi:unnamed protein product [Symbiodinium microadriaticum]|nr:unnamed protein product [Symbiodinium microadriaticum]
MSERIFAGGGQVSVLQLLARKEADKAAKQGLPHAARDSGAVQAQPQPGPPSAEEGARYLEVLIEEAAGTWLKEHGGGDCGGDVQKLMIAFLTDAYKCPRCVNLGAKKPHQYHSAWYYFVLAIDFFASGPQLGLKKFDATSGKAVSFGEDLKRKYEQIKSDQLQEKPKKGRFLEGLIEEAAWWRRLWRGRRLGNIKCLVKKLYLFLVIAEVCFIMELSDVGIELLQECADKAGSPPGFNDTEEGSELEFETEEDEVESVKAALTPMQRAAVSNAETLLIMIQTPYMDLRIYFAIIPLPLAGHGPEPGIQSRGNCRDLS